MGRPIRFLKVSARDQRSSHHLKEVRRYSGYANALRRAVQTRYRDTTGLNGSEIVETVLSAVLQIEVVDVGKRKVFDIPFLQIAAGEDQTLRILVRKFPQQHAISDAENSGAGANRQGNGHHYCDCEYRTLAQRAKRVGEVV